MNREEKIKIYQEWKKLHNAKLADIAIFEVGDKVCHNPGMGKFIANNVIFEIEKVDLDHTHGSYDGHEEGCYTERNVRYHIVAFRNDGSVMLRCNFPSEFLIKVR